MNCPCCRAEVESRRNDECSECGWAQTSPLSKLKAVTPPSGDGAKCKVHVMGTYCFYCDFKSPAPLKDIAAQIRARGDK